MDPIAGVGLVASVIQVLSVVGELIKYTSDVRNASSDQARLAREISSFAAFLTKFTYDVRHYDLARPEFASLAEIASENGLLAQLRAAISRLSHKVKRWSRLKRFFKSLTWPLDKREVDEVLTLIHRLTNYITMALTTDNVRLAIRIDSGVAELKEHTVFQKKASEFQAILKWISNLDFSMKQNDHFSRCHPGTGRWFLNHKTFEIWSGGHARTLWCYGQPGSGKTTLMSMIINHFLCQTDQQVGVAYLYFNYKEEQTQTAESLMASLLEQLVRKNPDSISPELRAKYKQHASAGTRLRLSETSELLHTEARRFSKTYIFVDALDECSRQDGNLDRFLAEIRSLRPYAHILVTSRTAPSADIDSDLSLEIRANSDDIRSYLQSRLQTEERLGRMLRNDESLKETITEQIANNAEGMFLLAQLQIDFLSRKNNRRDIRRSLEKLPRELNDVYEAALRRIASQSQEDALLAERLLLWIICAKRPLKRTEVQHALAVEADDTDLVEEGIPDEDILIEACAGLVTVDGDSGIVRLVHYTAQEYFEETFCPRLDPFRVEMATTCITYLSFNALSPESELNSLLVTHPLLPYAAQHWSTHAYDATLLDPSGTVTLQDKILSFCNTKSRIQMWYRVIHRAESGYDLDASSVESLGKITGLHVACGLGLVHIVGRMLMCVKSGDLGTLADTVNAVDMNGDTPLHWAAEKGRDDVVELLLNECGDVIRVDEPNMRRRTPLWVAAENGHALVVERIVSTGKVDVNRVDELTGTGETVLWRASDRGHAGVVSALLKFDPVDVNARDNVYGETPVLRAVGQGHVEVVREILKQRKDVDIWASDRFYGETPLDRAREKGFGEIISLLEGYKGQSSAEIGVGKGKGRMMERD